MSNAYYLWSDGSFDSVTTVSSPTILSVTVTDFFGCISTGIANITQSQIVDLGDSTFFCPGNHVVLDADTAGTYFYGARVQLTKH